MQKISLGGWVHYLSDKELERIYKNESVDNNGKWMYFFNNIKVAQDISERLSNLNIVDYFKYTDMNKTRKTSGVLCIYCDKDDVNTHRKIIEFMLENNMIEKLDSGKYKNLSFKLNTQTLNKEYGDKFNGQIKLSEFIDMQTGEWIFKDNIFWREARKTNY